MVAPEPISQRARLPWVTWLLPFLIFHIGTWASLYFKLLPGVASVYFPTTLGIVLVHWWGPRVLPALYLNALVCVPLWDLPLAYAPLYALPETLAVAASWFVMGRRTPDCAMPSRRHMLQLLGIGVLLPLVLCNIYLYLQLSALGSLRPDKFWLALGYGQLSDLLVFLAVGVPLWIFATRPLQCHGWALPPADGMPSLDDCTDHPAHLSDYYFLFGACALLVVVAWLFPLQRYWFLYAAPVLGIALLCGHRMSVLAMTWLFLLVFIIPAYFKEHFGATWHFDDDSLHVFLNLFTLSFATLITGRTISDLRLESARREQAARALKLQEDKWLAFLDHSPSVIYLKDLNGKYLHVNRAFEKLTGRPRTELIGQTDDTIFHPDVVACLQTMEEQTRQTLQPVIYHGHIPMPDSDPRRFVSVKFPLFDADQKLYALCGISTEITELARATAALERSEAFLRLSLDAANLGTWDYDLLSGRVEWSAEIEPMFGLPRGSFDGTFAYFARLVYLPDQPAVQKAIEDAVAGRTPYFHVEFRSQWPSGEIHWYESRGRVFRNAQGQAIRMAGVGFDITDRKRLETSLLQAQKVESIGRLAGGVAHDFNNLLTAILGSSEMLLASLPPDSIEARLASVISGAAQRGGALTQQLLGYARRQIAQPVVLNLNESVARSRELLKPLLGEDIDILIVPAQGLWPVKIDPVQVEQVLMNLAVNARDAMPSGGKLTFETQNVSLDADYCRGREGIAPGDYAMLAVSDTGTGIAAEVLPHIFDPFFTTKPLGRGTGLGLATCYGIVKQAGGHISAYSEPGLGATFKVYFPRTLEPSAAAPSQHLEPRLSGSETLLLVEDDTTIRTLMTTILQKSGFTVLSAGDGEAALKVARDHAGTIALLVTDVVMPKIGGRVLADTLLKERPALKVLYTSGYAENAIIHHGVLDDGIHFLQKPYTHTALIRKIREILDAPASVPTAVGVETDNDKKPV